jgi:hypothetical protein
MCGWCTVQEIKRIVNGPILGKKRMYSLTGFRDPREGFLIIAIWLPLYVSPDENLGVCGGCRSGSDTVYTGQWS